MRLSIEEQGAIALAWWRKHIDRRDEPGQRGLSARLRRGKLVPVLYEPAVHELGSKLGLGYPRGYELFRLATLLAEVRGNSGETLAQVLGGNEPVLSELRFQRLMRAEDAENSELVDHLRRAIHMFSPDKRVFNVAALAADLLNWEAARPRWCFHYFGADAPAKVSEETTE